MATIIDGKQLAAKVRAELIERVAKLKAHGVTPGLTVVLVGEDPASQIYVGAKEKMCGEVGIASAIMRLPANTSQDELLAVVQRLNADDAVHGILIQMPLPSGIDEDTALRAISPEKDVDGFHPVNAGMLFLGKPRFVPCTPLGIMRMFDDIGYDLAGKEAVVIGRSNIVGKPMAQLLLMRSATVTICHSRTKNLAETTRRADVVVVAIGKRNFLTADMVKPGAVVIDVGINRREGSRKIDGDVDYAAVEPIASAITPVPGGVGPMTVTMLMQSTVESAERAAGLS